MEVALLTIGEMAKYFDLSKQTLLYYEKMGLLVPHKVEENGYRYYSRHECQLLEIIVSLKKINMPLKDIQEYLEERSADHFEKVLKHARDELTKELADIYTRKDQVESALEEMHSCENMPLWTVFFGMEEEAVFYETNFYPSPRTSMKEKMMAMLRHKKYLLGLKGFSSFRTGYMIEEDNLKRGYWDRFSKLVTRINPVTVVESKSIRERGLYITIYIRGTYHEYREEVRRLLEEFMDRNELSVAGDLYIEPLENYWTNCHSDKYLLRISLPVKVNAKK